MIHTKRITSALILFGLGTSLWVLLATPRSTFGEVAGAKAQNTVPMDIESVANRVFANAEDLRKKGRYADAIAAYNELIAQCRLSPQLADRARVEKISATTEKALADEKAASEKAATSKVSTTDADASAEKIIDTATQLRKKGNFTEAVAAYNEAIALKDVSAAIQTKAREDKAAATLEKAKADNPGAWKGVLNTLTAFLGTSTKSLVTLMLWTLVLAIVFGIVWLCRNLVRARDGMLVDVQDLSTTNGDNGSRLLSSEIKQTLSPPDGSSDDEFESMKDFEGAGSASIRPMVELPGLDSMLATANPIAIGPIQFTPATLLALLRRLFQRRYQQTLSGALFVQGSRTVMTAQLTSIPFKTIPFKKETGEALPNGSWHLAQEGVDAKARQGLLRKIAARIMILQAGENRLTANAASLEAVLEGIDRLRASSGRNRTPEWLRETVECFQTALSHDPGNWVARFNLSVLARQLGDNEFAIQNCEMLEKMICPEAQGNDLATQDSETEKEAAPSKPHASPEPHADEAATQESEAEAIALPPKPPASREADDDDAAPRNSEIEEKAPPSKPPASLEAHAHKAATQKAEAEAIALPPKPPASLEAADGEAATQNSKTVQTVTPRSPSLRAHVAKHPSFLDSVRYNRALALSKIQNWEANKRAVKLLDAIISKTDGALNPLAMSAKAAALLFQVTQLEEALKDAKVQAKKAKEPRKKQHEEDKPHAEMDQQETETEHKEAKPQAEMDKPETETEHKEAKPQAEMDKPETETEHKEDKPQAEMDKPETKEHKEDKPQAEIDKAKTKKPPAEARRQAELDKVKKEILKICADLEELTKRGELTRGLALAYAVALNAKGFLLERNNDRANARRTLAAAAASQPNFVEPHINLARLYRHGQQKVADDWVVRAQGHLAQALALQPENRDANYQMGRLLSSEAMLRYADALEAFAKAAPHSEAAYWAAEIYFDSDFAEADRAKGIEQLRTSIRLSPKPNFRLGKLADHCLDAAEQLRNSAITALALATSSLSPQRSPGSPLPAEVQKQCDRARDYLEEANRAVRRMAKSRIGQLERWAEKAAARSAEILKGFPT